MPQFPRSIINSTFYLYSDAEAAYAGRNAQGTGFLVTHSVWGNSRSQSHRHFVYAVTNQHVASQFPVIRLGSHDGSIRVIDLDPSDWDYHSEGDDIAVALLCCTDDYRSYERTSINTQIFVKKEWACDVGVGDEAFMVGLFVDHEGVERNSPLARFGNISMLPNDSARIQRKSGPAQLSYILDMHSRSGFSGSPVFVYRTFGSDLSGLSRYESVRVRMQSSGSPEFEATIETKPFLRLLGIHWGQFPEEHRIRVDESARKTARVECSSLVSDGSYIVGYSGMTLAVPAWRIEEFLESKPLQAKRDERDPPR